MQEVHVIVNIKYNKKMYFINSDKIPLIYNEIKLKGSSQVTVYSINNIIGYRFKIPTEKIR